VDAKEVRAEVRIPAGAQPCAPHRRCRGDAGATLVEFGLVAPILFLLVFGIVEFGWAFFQNLDVRHAAREGARLAAVNYKETPSPSATTQRDEIVAEICERMDDDDGVSVLLHRPGTAAVGQEIDVRIRQEYDTLTGFLDFALGHIDHLESHVEIRIEQAATWQSAAGTADSDYVTCP
jgi:hypothetical protein